MLKTTYQRKGCASNDKSYTLLWISFFNDSRDYFILPINFGSNWQKTSENHSYLQVLVNCFHYPSCSWTTFDKKKLLRATFHMIFQSSNFFRNCDDSEVSGWLLFEDFKSSYPQGKKLFFVHFFTNIFKISFCF